MKFLKEIFLVFLLELQSSMPSRGFAVFLPASSLEFLQDFSMCFVKEFFLEVMVVDFRNYSEVALKNHLGARFGKSS